MYKIEFNQEDCMGCGACVSCDNWVYDDNGKAKPIKTELDEIGCNELASQICPAQIIKIKKL